MTPYAIQAQPIAYDQTMKLAKSIAALQFKHCEERIITELEMSVLLAATIRIWQGAQ